MSRRGSPSERSIYRRAFAEARPRAGLIALYFAIGLLASPLSLLTPVPIKIVADSVIGGQPPQGVLQGLSPDAVLAFAVFLTIGVALLRELQARGTELTRTYASEMLVLGFRARILRHAQRLSVLRHDRSGTADATYRIMWDASAISAIALDGVIPIVIATVTAASMLIVIWNLDPQLGMTVTRSADPVSGEAGSVSTPAARNRALLGPRRSARRDASAIEAATASTPMTSTAGS